ncbi:outer membrane beta-barrel protein [Tenacibaculum pacificus]|uniref:outer membrane beta-barrel protein n=1 Tax=Tenacibaculum pacificus TaxID=3018314 RepID=UPI0022F3EAB7|nr:outer membrane beta-barrel protein [Tenacibaculum pacificus]WBX74545.1 outer membrane beta-barrel protein [Tenacibaculum pacificus]
MKKVLLTIAIIAAGFTANAQDKNEAKGGFAQEDIYVSGTVGFATYKQGDSDSNGYNFSPSVGYFIAENIALELGLGIGGTTNIDDSKSSSFGVNAGAKYFFTPQNDFSFVVGAGLDYSVQGNESAAGVKGNDTNTFAIAVAPGVNYFVSESVALRASVGALSYESKKEDADRAEARNTFGLNLNLSAIQFGLTYKF